MAYGPSQVYDGYDAAAFAEAVAGARRRQQDTLLALIQSAPAK